MVGLRLAVIRQYFGKSLGIRSDAAVAPMKAVFRVRLPRSGVPIPAGLSEEFASFFSD
jgi:hypothetical protein